jgi:hypothetical protein
MRKVKVLFQLKNKQMCEGVVETFNAYADNPHDYANVNGHDTQTKQ